MPFNRNCDDTLKWDGLSDAEAGTYLNSASITYALYHPSGTAVSGGSGTLTYVVASNGNYKAEIDAAVTALMVADKVRVVMVATQGGYKDTREFWESVQTRGRS